MYTEMKKTYITNQLGWDYSEGPNDELIFHCPRCPELGKRNDDKKLYVNLKTGLYWCHRCEWKGRFTFGKHMDDFKMIDIEDDIYNFFDVNEDESDDDEFIYKEIPPTRLVDAKFSNGYKYMRSRGFTDEMMDQADMRIDPTLDAGKLFGRVVIPNEVQYKIFTDIYVARSFVGDFPKYLYPVDSNKSKIVYNLHNIDDNPDELYINEGALDSIIAGLDKSVSIYGKHCSRDQLNQLVKKGAKRYYVSLDSDAREQSDALCERLYSLVQPDVEIYQVHLPEGKDAVDLGRDLYLEIAKSSERYIPKRFQPIINYFE